VLDAFGRSGKWYKGNLHAHTTSSDGAFTHDELLECYREKGYDFVAITDHNKCLDPDVKSEDMLVIPGVEFNFYDMLTGAYFHLVGIGLEGGVSLPERIIAENAISMINARGGEVIVAHPYWLGLTLNDMAPLKKSLGIEIFNKTCTSVGRGYSTVHWDDLLTSGRKTWGFAVDDTHGALTRFAGWVMVKSGSLDMPSIMESLRLGHFYSTQGPEFLDIAVSGSKLRVKCSPVSNIHFICSNRRGRNEQFYRSYEQNKNYECIDSVFTSAEYQIEGNEKYIRVEIVDSAGRWAWSNPIFLD
jgi:hypothetical protein